MSHDSDKDGEDVILEREEKRDTIIDTLPPPTEPPGQENDEG